MTISSNEFKVEMTDVHGNAVSANFTTKDWGIHSKCKQCAVHFMDRVKRGVITSTNVEAIIAVLKEQRQAEISMTRRSPRKSVQENTHQVKQKGPKNVFDVWKNFNAKTKQSEKSSEQERTRNMALERCKKDIPGVMLNFPPYTPSYTSQF